MHSIWQWHGKLIFVIFGLTQTQAENTTLILPEKDYQQNLKREFFYLCC